MSKPENPPLFTDTEMLDWWIKNAHVDAERALTLRVGHKGAFVSDSWDGLTLIGEGLTGRDAITTAMLAAREERK